MNNLQKVVARYVNCVQPAIIQYKGEIIKAVTSPPLHVFRSLGEQMYVVETAEIVFDDMCKHIDGAGVPQLQQPRLKQYAPAKI